MVNFFLFLLYNLKKAKPPLRVLSSGSWSGQSRLPHWLACLCSDLSNGADGMLATSSNGSQYSGSRVETPVSYVGEDDDDDDDFNENDEEDWLLNP